MITNEKTFLVATHMSYFLRAAVTTKHQFVWHSYYNSSTETAF
jgi:hypothetical protein